MAGEHTRGRSLRNDARTIVLGAIGSVLASAFVGVWNGVKHGLAFLATDAFARSLASSSKWLAVSFALVLVTTALRISRPVDRRLSWRAAEVTETLVLGLLVLTLFPGLLFVCTALAIGGTAAY